MSEKMKIPGQLVFGLDIGTRSIVGTVGYTAGERFHVVAQCIREHETRSMLDGQIHDIHKVGTTISEVKSCLEEKIGRPLKDVCIAAAGRVLRTVTTHVDYEFLSEKELTGEDIYALDSLGIEKAYEEFLKDNDIDIKFYCVGYSIMHYYLNYYAIGNLEGHRAKVIGEDIIATFLPDDVVDGLYKAVGQAGLEVANMTLEPIAAIQVAIPQQYRMLNIALVDVGAGTSDISITKDGSIVAYGMIPTAGDSLTEVIAKHCLVDFKTAEAIKRSAAEQEKVEYKDILGLSQTISKEEILKVAEPVLRDMTKQVSDKIKELNGGKSVSAVFVVGGGGTLQGYTDYLAEALEIQKERVAIRGEEVMQQVEFYDESARRDSLMVTPIGICLSFYEQSNNFVFVYFNEQRVKLYDNNKLAVVDAAMQAEFPNSGLFPKRGKELNYTVNGKARIARGTLGEAAVIKVNGNVADIHTQIRANDHIEVIESTAGEPASVDIGQLPEYGKTMSVEVNETKIELPEYASVNGELQSGYYSIQENDSIEFLKYYTVKQIAEFMDVAINEDLNIYVNNKLADMDTKVYENFSVIWTMEELQLSDRDIYGSGEEDTYANLPEDDGSYVKSEEIRAQRPDLGEKNENMTPLSENVADAVAAGLYAANAANTEAETGQAGVNVAGTAGTAASQADSYAAEAANAAGSQAGSYTAGVGNSAANQTGPHTEGASNATVDQAGPYTAGAGNSAANRTGAHTAGALNTAAGQAGPYTAGMSNAAASQTGSYTAGASNAAASQAESYVAGTFNGGTGQQGNTSATGTSGATDSREIDIDPADIGRIKTPQEDIARPNGNIPRSIYVNVNGEQIRLEGKTDYVFVDVFNYIDFDLSRPKGSGVATELNGRNAQYMEPINSGDMIKIYWKD